MEGDVLISRRIRVGGSVLIGWMMGTKGRVLIGWIILIIGTKGRVLNSCMISTQVRLLIVLIWREGSVNT